MTPLPDRRPTSAALADGAARLREALARTIPQSADLARTAEALSVSYRLGDPPATPARHVRDDRTAGAYAAARMPATFAAIGRAMAEAVAGLPGFEPHRMLDLGAGTGAAAWAATTVWPTIDDLTLVDREPAVIALGQRVAAFGNGALASAVWQPGDLATAILPTGADLVAAAYVLGELPDAARDDIVARMWAATRGALVLVEPGSRAGFARIRSARDLLIQRGAAIAAPCPGTKPCPVSGADWCHFLVRLDRSPLHQRAKTAARSWEDEPFSYVVATRLAANPAPRIVLGRPRHRPGRVELRVCEADGAVHRPTLSRRDGDAYRAARDLAWGDRVPPEIVGPDHAQP